MTFDPRSPGLLGVVESELDRQRQIVAAEVARLAALEEMGSWIFAQAATHGPDFVIEDLDHLERLCGGDPVSAARLEDLIRRSAPTRRIP